MSLKEFADLISGGYPDDIKAKISAKVEEEAKNIRKLQICITVPKGELLLYRMT